MTHVVVVGASLGGLCTVEALRRNGFEGAITLVGDEDTLPYDRPPLSKQVLSGTWQPPRTALRDDDALAALDLTLRRGVRALSLNTAQRQVELADGSLLRYDSLVVATGVTAQKLPGQRPLTGVHTLRSINDAVAIRDELAARPRVAIVGGGFIGTEVAAEARRRGLDVTLIEAQPVPLARGLGNRMGAVFAGLHERNGVDVRCGRWVTGLEGTERVERVRLSNGGTVEADLVVVGIGAVPAVDWLAGSGIAVDDGVRCDEYCRASVPDVYAVGDVARWHHAVYGEHIRVEHWTNAREQASTVAHNLLHPDAPQRYAPVPYVWSDQYGLRVQVAGRGVGDVEIIHQDGESLLALYHRDDRFEGALAVSAARKLLPYRQLLSRAASWREALATAASAI